MSQFLTYGLQNGILKHISDVSNGLACDCICPHCKQMLVAKNNPNNKKESHFAHYSAIECEGAIETALHLLFKEVLLKNKRMFLPNYHYDYMPANEWTLFSKGVEIVFDEIILEKSVDIDGIQIIPDVVGIKKNRQIFIEFAHTHFVDEEKKKKIKKSDFSCIEINLKGQELNEKSILDFLNTQTNNIYWIINQRLDLKYKQKIKEEAELQNKRKEQIKIENSKKIERYRKENLVLTVNKKGEIVCPKKSAILKETELYKIPLLKRIIDGEHWNGMIYKNYSEESIYLKNKKINLSSQEEWKGLKRMLCKIPDWSCCDYYQDYGCEYHCPDYNQCHKSCKKCIFFIENLEIEYKQYIICNFHKHKYNSKK